MKKDGTIGQAGYEKWFGKKPDADDLAVVITPGYGVPGMPGYDPTPHELKCGADTSPDGPDTDIVEALVRRSTKHFGHLHVLKGVDL